MILETTAMLLDPRNARDIDDLKYRLTLGHTVKVTLSSDPPKDSDYALYLKRGAIERTDDEVAHGNGAATGSRTHVWRGNVLIRFE